jgi:nucleoside-triphosphatase
VGKIWAITGAPGVGKSTFVSKVVLRMKGAGVIVGGCTTSERRVRGVRVGFEVRNLTDGETGELASVGAKLGPRVGRYRVNLSDLARVGALGLKKAAASSELIVVDEVGPLELVSPEFRKGVEACIASEKPMLVVLHERLDDDLLNKLRASASKTIELSLENRDSAVDEIVEDLLAAVGGPKAS